MEAKAEVKDVIQMRGADTGLADLVDAVWKRAGQRPLSMVEIGSYAGESMEIFAKTGKVAEIACVDPWANGYDSRDQASYTDMAKVESLFDERAGRMSVAGIDVYKHKGTIDTFLKSDAFAKLSGRVDFVYIDGCHTYDAVKRDLLACIQAVKPKVAVCGHDWHPFWAGVMNAVFEIVGMPSMTFEDGSWAKFSK